MSFFLAEKKALNCQFTYITRHQNVATIKTYAKNVIREFRGIMWYT
jgi:hypothetical protein